MKLIWCLVLLLAAGGFGQQRAPSGKLAKSKYGTAVRYMDFEVAGQ